MDIQEKEELEYYRKKEELYRYAKEFQLQLAKDGFVALAYMDLNIHFVNGFNEFNSGIFKAVQGISYLRDFTPNPVIKVFGIDFMDITSIKQDIRHEMLHYTLWLHNLPHNDDSPEFHAMCKIYKAGAYKKVPKEKQEYCRELKQLSKEDLYRKLLNGYIDCYDIDNKPESYYDAFAERRSGIKRIYTNDDVKKIKREVI